MNNIELKTILSNLIKNNLVAVESGPLIEKYKEIILKSNVDVATNPIEINQVIETYTRRKQTLTMNDLHFYGLDETIHALKNKKSKLVVIMHSIYQSYNITLFFDEKMSLLLGALILEKQEK